MSTRYRWSVLWTIFLRLASPAAAQQPANSVAIHPIATSVDVAPYSTNTQRFWVVNDGTQSNQYSIFANVCTPYDLYCEWSTTFLGTIASNDSVPVDVKFTAGHAGTSGTISFDARINTNQSIRATKNFTVNARQETHLEVAAFNPGSAEERDLCLTVSVATDAAYECGDLRLVHALPSVRARGTVRTPTLLYNSRFAHPFGLVAATFSTPPHDLTSVTAQLRVPRPGGDIVVSQGFSDALFTASSDRKFVLAFDASALPTGVYPYTVTTTFSLAGTPDSVSASGELIVVNWKTSPFGAGWWLAGYERIYPQSDSSLLWVGGDGSARHYTSAGGGVYKAPGIDRPDSITADSAGNYVRHLRSRATVQFASNGKHFATTDRLGLVTFFHHDQYGQMFEIDPAGFGSLAYTFAYSSFTGPLETVTAPSVGGVSRIVQRYVLVDGRILQHTDPDGTVVQFGFGNASMPEQITSRVNRRSIIQSFGFDAVGKLVTVRVPLNASDTAVTTFCPAESRGFVSTSCSAGPLYPDSAVTVMNGPRPDADAVDVTTFRQDRFGAPKLIRDALGNQTQLFRGNRDFPGLVTRLVHANGWVNDAFHDGKGLITKLVQYAPLGPDRDAVTEYTWDAKWERVTQITFPEQNVLQFAYDTATGNRIWQQDGRGDSSRVDFSYLPDGSPAARLLASVRYQADPVASRARDTLEYDALGNLETDRRAVGTSSERVSRFANDAIGRVMRTAVDLVSGGAQQRRDSTSFDVMDRVLATKAYGFGTAAESLFTASTYDGEGNLRRLERWSYPDNAASPIGHIVTRWGFDLGNRVVADTAPDGPVETRVYDRASNVISVQTRRGDVITMIYDAVSRLTTRNVPGVTYDTIMAGIAARDNDPYPRQPNNGRMYAVPTDTELFAYDTEGRVTSANNNSAHVAREYFANGLPKNETLEIRNARDTTFSHSYQSRYSYDLNGRRTALGLPTQLVPAGTRDSIGYQYSNITGELQRVTDPLGNEFAYGYTLRGEPSSLSFPNNYVQRWSYFPDGSLRTDSVRNVGTLGGSRLSSVARATAFTYDVRGSLLNSGDATGFRDTLTATYSGLGYVLSNRMRQDGQLQGFAITDRYVTVEQTTYDALGNMMAATTADTSWFNNTPQQKNWRQRTLTYASGVGRLTAESGASSKTYRYDQDGNTVFSMKEPSGGQASPNSREDRATYYSADGRVRAADYRFISNGLVDESPRDWVFEEYRYDALGRRVWVRAYRSCAFYTQKTGNSKFLECHTSTLRRTVWDQERELIEIQVPGDSAQADSVLEGDSSARLPRDSANNDPNPHFGRVVYVHGLELDRPIAITRYNYIDFGFGRPYTDFPPSTYSLYWTARGQMSMATCATGTIPCTQSAAAMLLDAEAQWFAYDRPKFAPWSFQGTLIHDKDDAARTTYKRNRYYDPAVGRFTQEDPVGLAGGINLYGFAAGDPVNFSDPFGLRPCPPDNDCGPSLQDMKYGAVFVQLGQMAPAINHEVAWFLPKNAAAAASGLAVETVVGRVLGWITGRSVGSAVSAGSEDFITLYHQGNLAGGRVLATRSLSTSTSPELTHYAPGEALQAFKIPRSVFQAWDKAGYVTRYTDSYRGIVTSEIRIEAGASGELNKYLVKP